MHSGNDGVALEHVAHDNEVLSRYGTRVLLVQIARVDGSAAVLIHDTDLAMLEVRIGLFKYLEHFLGIVAHGQKFDYQRSEARIGT
jgi:hypothetical protein